MMARIPIRKEIEELPLITGVPQSLCKGEGSHL